VIVGALATIGLLDHHRDELVLVGITRISHVVSFGHADRHHKFLAVELVVINLKMAKDILYHARKVQKG
jgi:hypothetical protein